MGCVCWVSYTLFFNGQKVGSFLPQCELRRGNPFSPYLFISCANVMSYILLQLEDQNKNKGISFGRPCLSISHLMNADDAILFFQPTSEACGHNSLALQQYSRLVGQDVNKNKSKIIFSLNVPHLHKCLLASTFGISYSPSLWKYL